MARDATTPSVVGRPTYRSRQVGFPSEVFCHRLASCDIDAKRDCGCSCISDYESMADAEFYASTPINALLALLYDSYVGPVCLVAARTRHQPLARHLLIA